MTDREATSGASSLRELSLKAYRFMLLARVIDDKFASLYRAGKIHGGVFLGRGQEALSVSIGLALREGDVFAPLIRDQAGRLAFGEPLIDAVRTYLGSELGPMRGRDGNVHRGDPQKGLLPMISHLGAMISVVNGALFARRMKGITGTVGVACLGEGATSTGAFHEALNQAAIEKLPLVVVVANNQYAYSTPNDRQFACAALTDKAVGYGMQSCSVDGTDLRACLDVVGEAVEQARAGGGPRLVVATLLRLCGHGEHDDAGYIVPELKNSHLGRDCLKVAEEFLLREKWADNDTLAQWRSEAVQQVETTVATVQREPSPDPFNHEWRALSTAAFVETHDAESPGPVEI
ncbi:MAG TPA: thiamine pyrophosphate-dependent dehydrogenase E1 component subunit alpha [Verrucomicrobiota bacterium]|nr:thiamine pyrophosphate-dependent dehydrogenase E1 component subunit alpha [Verrucomicrobiota bacterium]